MAERSINPKSLGKRSKDKILKKFSRTFQIPLENEADLIEWLRSTGVKAQANRRAGQTSETSVVQRSATSALALRV